MARTIAETTEKTAETTEATLALPLDGKAPDALYLTSQRTELFPERPMISKTITRKRVLASVAGRLAAVADFCVNLPGRPDVQVFSAPFRPPVTSATEALGVP